MEHGAQRHQTPGFKLHTWVIKGTLRFLMTRRWCKTKRQCLMLVCQQAVVSDRAGEPHSLFRRVDPAPLSDLKWLQLSRAAMCKGGDLGGVVQRSQKQIREVGWWGGSSDSSCEALSAPTVLHLFLANYKVSIWRYSSLHNAKLVPTAGSARTVFHSHRQGARPHQNRSFHFEYWNCSDLKVQELSHSQEIQYHRRWLMNIPNQIHVASALHSVFMIIQEGGD